MLAFCVFTVILLTLHNSYKLLPTLMNNFPSICLLLYSFLFRLLSYRTTKLSNTLNLNNNNAHYNTRTKTSYVISYTRAINLILFSSKSRRLRAITEIIKTVVEIYNKHQQANSISKTFKMILVYDSKIVNTGTIKLTCKQK